jgi:hypothetical protein
MDMRLVAILGLVIVISIIDLGINLVSFIPVIGDLLETGGEAILEVFQIALVGLMVAIAGKDS